MKIYIYLPLFIILLYTYLLIGTNSAPVFETTEGRYAEIAREMLVSSDYITPRLNGIKHFHKPPFTYWMAALGMKLFGINAFGLRFFGIIATLICILSTFFTARLFLKDDYQSFISTVILSTSLLFLIVSRVVSTDIYLTCLTSLSMFFLFRQIYGEKSHLNSCFYALFLGLAFLTKGPVVFIFTIIPYLVGKLFFKNHRHVFTKDDIIKGLIIFLVVALPWYIIIIVKNPHLLEYFIGTHIAERVTSTSFNRNEPFYFFILIFFSTFIPYIFFLLKGIFKIKKSPDWFLHLYLYIIVPLIFFSLCKSKLATYILPFYGISSIIVTYVFYNYKSDKLTFISYILLLILQVGGLIAFIIKFNVSTLPTEAHILLILWLVGIILTGTFMFILYNNFIFNMCLSLYLFVFFAYMLTPYIEGEIKGYKGLTKAINIMDPMKKYEVVVYQAFVPSISFYRNKLAIMALSKERETQFEKDENYKKFYKTSTKELLQLFKDEKKFFVVTNPKHIKPLEETYRIKCIYIARQKDHSAYFCEKS